MTAIRMALAMLTKMLVMIMAVPIPSTRKCQSAVMIVVRTMTMMTSVMMVMMNGG